MLWDGKIQTEVLVLQFERSGLNSYLQHRRTMISFTAIVWIGIFAVAILSSTNVETDPVAGV